MARCLPAGAMAKGGAGCALYKVLMRQFSNGFLIPAMLLGLMTACAPPKVAAPLKPPAVTVSRPALTTVTNWDEYPGHLEAVEMVEVRPRVAGYIDSIEFQDGAEVKAGDLLFTIDPRPYQTAFDHTQAMTRQAETHLDLAKRDLERAEGLRGTKAISEEEYDSRRNAMRMAESALVAAKAEEATARINLDYTRITAPIGGKIGRRMATPGNFVQLQGSSGAAPVLATIVKQSPIYCYFDAQESAFLKYTRNGNPIGQLLCELALVNESGFPHKGIVDFVDNQVDARTGTMRLRAVFPNQDRALVPGLFANVRVPAGAPVQSLLIPDVAVGSDQGRKFVYIVNPTNMIETRMITTDRQHGTLRAVVAGLTPEDRVVVNGLMMIRPGAKVEVTP
jgi:RND family efflux transporter MFP subunit